MKKEVFIPNKVLRKEKIIFQSNLQKKSVKEKTESLKNVIF